MQNSTVEAINDGNNAEAGFAAFSELSEAQLHSIEAIAMDMSSAYVKAAKQAIPLAETKIVHDRFHIMQMATKVVDNVRLSEHPDLLNGGDDRLSRTKHVWLTSHENLSEKQQSLFDQTLKLKFKTGQAWSFKEMLRDLWGQDTAPTATTYFND